MADCLYAWYSSQTKACLLQKITIYLLTLHVLWKQSKLLLGKFRRFTVLQNCNAFERKKGVGTSNLCSSLFITSLAVFRSWLSSLVRVWLSSLLDSFWISVISWPSDCLSSPRIRISSFFLPSPLHSISAILFVEPDMINIQ